MAEDKKQTKLGRFGEWFTGPQVIISIGPDKVKYHLPKARLVQDDVPFFKAAFAGSFSEATTNTLDLESEEVQVFNLFVEWLLCGAVPLVPISPDQRFMGYEDAETNGLLPCEKPWHQLACMAHRFCCQNLEKEVFRVLETYYDDIEAACHPTLLEHDYLHMSGSTSLDDFALAQLEMLEGGSTKDYCLMLEFLGSKAPEVLVKTLRAKQRRSLVDREEKLKRIVPGRYFEDDGWGNQAPGGG